MSQFLKKTFSFIYCGCLFLLLASFQGISYRHFPFSSSISVFVLEVDPQQYRIFPVHAFNQAIGRKTVKELADEHHAIAAINGGFFKSQPSGLPAGILKIQHQWFGWPTKPRGAIGWSTDADVVLFDQLLCQGTITISNRKFLIDGLNRPPQKSEVTIFTPTFSSTTLTSSSQGFEMIVRQNRLLLIQEGGNHFIPRDGYVISFSSKEQLPFWQAIPRQTPIHLKLEILPQRLPFNSKTWDHLPHIVGGTPLLIHQGRILTNFSSEKTTQTFLDQPHARSAVGLLPNGHWIFVVVEGKHPNEKQGMIISELANLMASLGCCEALNLDGGGSSTMVYEGKVVNHPTGDEEKDIRLIRAVSDAILIKQLP